MTNLARPDSKFIVSLSAERVVYIVQYHGARFVLCHDNHTLSVHRGYSITINSNFRLLSKVAVNDGINGKGLYSNIVYGLYLIVAVIYLTP